MGFEQEAFERLVHVTWDNRSKMQREMLRGAKGEPFVVQQLYIKGPMTPSQIAQAMGATTGRVSTLLAGLEKKGQIVREPDPDDRRSVHIRLTETGEERAHRQRESMRDAICWIFSQMGERRTREFIDLTTEFTTYMTLCMPGKPRPTPEQVAEAFSGNTQEEA
ncbi:MarR family winged helix-turn-helix transcriptional regulator [Bifidobacterium sp.]|uniref:MarR family winged helix-turn-helix transcriptional regulator n=1 Tax=Bifidobacterium sp. TaxID=41200 RepID=UPI003D7CEF34